MDIHAQKLGLIEKLLKIKNEALLEFAEGEEKKRALSPMSLDRFYQQIMDSDEAILKGDVIAHKKLRKQAKDWKWA